ncbi:MAG: cobyric acid synthase [Planctomycetaceae bacterium]|nr:cobyric acid synthase [Planctomycetaceae bacterium]
MTPPRPPRVPALMVLGTASHVGKSLIAAAFCRLLAESGYRVAPFKAQNMALNSFVTPEGGEIGRAQVAQAEAAGIEPHVDMNPILLKPMGGATQVVVAGAPIGVMSARDYYAAKDRLWPLVAAAYDRLAGRFDRIILEGAGSPVEINLAEHDLTNLRMARHADAAVVLVADIERGGVFAQLVGTWELLGPEDRARVVGFVINKFRGDPTLLEPGLELLRARTGVPVLGVLPFLADLQIDQEDSLGIDATATAAEVEPGPDDLDVAVARLPGLSNFTDFWPLARLPGVHVRYVERGPDLGRPDLVVLPGTKTTVRDLDWLRRVGLADRVVALARDESGPIVLGICGGFQMLGTRIDDPLRVESATDQAEGLGLLDVTTRFDSAKARHRVTGSERQTGLPLTGYEIHMGETLLGASASPWSTLTRQHDGATIEDGAVAPSGQVFGTYVHGLFDSLPFTASLVDRLRARKGLPPLDPGHWQAHRDVLAARHAALADLLRTHLDLGPIREALSLA